MIIWHNGSSMCHGTAVLLQDAIASCPVDCIHWVEKDQLPALEYVMANQVQVTDVGTMMGGAGHVADVFAAADQFLKKRKKE